MDSFSALKMDGKPLYEYARKGIPLPRPIAARKVTVSALSLLQFVEGSEHTYEFPKESLDDAAKAELARIEKMVKEGGTVIPSDAEAEAKPVAPVVDISGKKFLPSFPHLRMEL